jgi:hypothetical protein
MSTVNNRPQILHELRSKGHVLITMYKSLCSRPSGFFSPYYPTFKWKSGWNYSDENVNKENFIPIDPYTHNARITKQIHMGMEKKDVDGIGGVIVNVEVYADEITGCGISPVREDMTCTAPRVFLKELPENPKDVIMINREDFLSMLKDGIANLV